MSRQISKGFASLASRLSKWMGSHWAVLGVAVLAVFGLAVFGIEKTNLGITIATLLMVLVLQNSQNRDSAAVHVKLDEIITQLEGPRDEVAGIETKSHEEIEEIQKDMGPVGDNFSAGDAR